ncbi:MAG TPA: metallopeptidase family protein, partial [Spirochaetota bacterium]|nr:metallopeptidase family protein [Spirochaetota bacterium]
PSDDTNDDTLGLYEGIPLSESTVIDPAIPGRIIIYRIPLMESCTGIRSLRKEIRITILHELGHHIGFDEDELAVRGLD